MVHLLIILYNTYVAFINLFHTSDYNKKNIPIFKNSNLFPGRDPDPELWYSSYNALDSLTRFHERLPVGGGHVEGLHEGGKQLEHSVACVGFTSTQSTTYKKL